MAASMSQALPETRILISGMGIAGQILAFWLLRANLNIHIVFIERGPDMRKNGQGIDLRVEGVDVIRKMGLEQALRDSTTKEGGVRFVYDNNETYAYWPASDAEFSLSSDIEIMRGDLVALLNGALPKGSIEYRYSTSIADFDERGDRIDVTFQNGKSESFDMVLAGEGQNSTTRKLLQHKGMVKGVAPGKPEGEAYWSLSMIGGLFTMQRRKEDGDDWRMCQFTHGRGLSFRPASEGLMSVYLAVYNRDRNDELLDSAHLPTDQFKAFLRKEFKGVGWTEAPRLLDEMDASTDFYALGAAQIHVDKWSSPGGRVAVVGDAAYCPTPATGKGTTLAVVGSYTLAWAVVQELRSAQSAGRKPDFASATKTWEDMTRPYITKNQKLLPGVPNLINPQTWWGLIIFQRVIMVLVFFMTNLLPIFSKLSKWLPGKKDDRGIILPEWID